MYKKSWILLLLVISFTFVSAGELKVTQEHPFLINGSWIDASQLKIGDELTLSNGSKVKITKLTDVVSNESFKVYNLEAGEYHNFVVGEEGVVVHNSNLGQDVSWNPLPSKGRLTESRLETLLTKPIGGSKDIAKYQAGQMRYIDYNNGFTDRDNLIAALQIERSSSKLFPSSRTAQELDMYDSILEILITGKSQGGIQAQSTMTSFGKLGLPFDSTKKWGTVKASANRNIPGLKDGNSYTQYYPYKINNNGVQETVYVEHTIAFYNQEFRNNHLVFSKITDANGKDITHKFEGQVTFYARGGVLSTKNPSDLEFASLPKLMNVLDDLTKTAVSAPTKIERAYAIAEWEWVNAVTTPSGFGGGTILAKRDYKLLEAAGFDITEYSFRRIELEALSRTREDFIKIRINELMNRR